MRKGIRGMKGAVLMETIQKENRPSATHTRLLMNAAGRWLMLNCKELGELILYFFSNDFLLTLEKKNSRKEKIPSPAEFTKMAESIRHFFPNTGNSVCLLNPTRF
jgi:hypothetical protein